MLPFVGIRRIQGYTSKCRFLPGMTQAYFSLQKATSCYHAIWMFACCVWFYFAFSYDHVVYPSSLARQSAWRTPQKNRFYPRCSNRRSIRLVAVRIHWQRVWLFTSCVCLDEIAVLLRVNGVGRTDSPRRLCFDASTKVSQRFAHVRYPSLWTRAYSKLSVGWYVQMYVS